jgi:hypothetical protein
MVRLVWEMTQVIERSQGAVRVAGCGSVSVRDGVAMCPFSHRSPLDYQKRIFRGREEMMWVQQESTAGAERWGGSARMVAVWPRKGEGRSNEMRQAILMERMDPEMGGR